jgi:predicted RNA-binding Zn ribbon-like protein
LSTRFAGDIIATSMASSQAPGRLETVRDFINTLEFSGGADDKFTAGPDELASWCRESGICPNIDDAGLARLRDFREALRLVLETHVAEGEEPALWQALEPFAEQACYKLHITSDGRPALRAQGAGADGAIAELFAIIYDAIADGTWARLKACRKHSCRFAFYDRSKNGSGVWCSMQVCGNRVKAQKRRLSRKKQPEK